jgi:hypothetical protein
MAVVMMLVGADVVVMMLVVMMQVSADAPSLELMADHRGMCCCVLLPANPYGT